MKRAVAVFGVVAALVAMALPAGATGVRARTDFALAGEARGLELAIGQEGASLGLAIARADSKPSALGVGAGQCTLLGDDADPNNLPCSEETTVKSNFPGPRGTGEPRCAGSLPAPLDTIVNLKLACGSSRSGATKGVPFTSSSGKVTQLGISLPVGTVLEAAPTDQLVSQLTQTLSPVLDKAPKEVKDAVDNVVDLISGLPETKAVAIELGPSSSTITSKGKAMRVDSAAAGALIGLVGVPEATVDGTAVTATSDPLKNGLVIIEVGSARASATIDRATATAAGAASAALVTVKVRDITQPEPTYVEVSVAPGETVTVLAGTPAESTITAADSTVTQEGSSAAAGANAVRLHVLKGVQGGVSLALGRVTAASNGNVVKPAPPIRKAPPEILPLTGGTDATLPAVALILAAGVALWVRRRLAS